MGRRGVLSVLIFAVMLASCTIAYEIKGSIEGIYLIRPDSKYIDKSNVPQEYISLEDLNFYACVEEPDIPIKTSVVCMDDNSFTDINMHKWSDQYNCYIGSFNAQERDCRDLRIYLIYVKDGETIQREKKIKVNRFSSMLDHVYRTQYSDGGWRDATETAAGIWVLSNYRDIFAERIDLGMRWLKLNRNNKDKCWPDTDCSIATTAKIMAYLTLAGHEDKYRVIHDGLIYLEAMQNFFLPDDVWNLTIFPFEPYNTSCILSYNNGLLLNESFWVLPPRSTSFKINPVPLVPLYVICDRNIRVNLSTQLGETVFIYEGDNLSYTMPDHCWSRDAKWGACDVTTTVFATISNISDDRKAKAMNYLVSQLHAERSGEQYVGHNKNISDSALFVYSAANSQFNGSGNVSSVAAWLRYKQNNNGSWGSGSTYEMIYPTGYSIMGMMKAGFNRSHEVISDADDWVVNEELKFSQEVGTEYVGWNSTEMNALAYIVLKNNARPILKSRPMTVLMDQESKLIEIYNPTTFRMTDVAYEFSDNLKGVLEIEKERKEIEPYSYIRLNLKRKVAETGNLYGYLSISNLGDETAKIPIIITSYPKLEMKPKEKSLVVFGTTAKLDFNVIKTGHSFQCTLTLEDQEVSAASQYTITSGSLSVDLTFSKAERLEKTYKGKFECQAAGQSFIIPFAIPISRYSSFPFTYRPEEIFVNDTADRVFYVKNKLDESLDVGVSFVKSQAFFEFVSQDKTIDPEQEVNFTIRNKAQGINFTDSTQIEITALGQKKTIPFRVDVTAEPEKVTNPLVLYSIIALLLALLIGSGVAGYYYRKQILALFQKKDNTDLIKMRIKKLEAKEKETAILNMVKIMKMLKKEDLTIRRRLLEEGFTEKEIDSALASENQEEVPLGEAGKKSVR